MELSVVIPTYNRPKPLKNCLEALRAQETNLDWEIVLVNDGGHIDQDLESYFSDLPLRLFHTENRGPGHARNYGVKQAAGRKIAFIDDDCQAGPNWLNHMARALRPRRLVAGQVINEIRQRAGSEASQLLLDYLMMRLKDTPEFFFTSNNLGAMRLDFLELGGFDNSFPQAAGEDREFCVRAGFKGWELYREPQLVVHHYHDLNRKKFWRMHQKYGRATHIYHQVKKQRGMDWPPVRLRGFYSGMLFYPFQKKGYSLSQKFLLLWFIGLSQLATLVGYWQGRSAKK